MGIKVSDELADLGHMNQYGQNLRESIRDNRGSSLVEAMIASAILLVAMQASYSYVADTMAFAKTRTMVSQVDGIESVFSAYLNSIVSAEGRSDLCLHSSRLKTSYSPLNEQQLISTDIVLEQFDSTKMDDYMSFFNDRSLPESWQRAFTYCQNPTGDSVCSILRVKKSDAGSDQSPFDKNYMVMAAAAQTPFDFKDNVSVSSGVCSNRPGMGIKANYVVFKAIKNTAAEQKITLRVSTGEVVHTTSSTAVITGDGFYPPFSACNAIGPGGGRCDDMSTVPPDPGQDPVGYAAFPFVDPSRYSDAKRGWRTGYK